MYFNFWLGLFSYIILIIGVLIGVASLTLLEHKVLGYIQVRSGPNKVGFCGILQPFADAIKLFSKEQSFPIMTNYYPYYLAPIFSLMLSLQVWLCIPVVSLVGYFIVLFFCAVLVWVFMVLWVLLELLILITLY